MIDSEFFVQCKQWQKDINAGLDSIIDRACKVYGEEPLSTAFNALSIIAKEFGDVIPITPETMEKYKGKREVFKLRVDIDFENYQIRISREEVNVIDENSSNG